MRKGHAKEFRFYLKDGGELFRHYEWRSDVIRIENDCAHDNHIKIS